MDTTPANSIIRVEGGVMPVNSYIVDGPEGLVIVDGQLTVSDAQAVRARVDATGRPVAAMIITHGHPDHYAGAATILDGLSAPIVATAGVAEVIRRDDQEKDGIVGAMMGAEWPSKRRFVDDVVDAGESVRVGGLEFAVHDLGPGESGNDTLWTLDARTIFSGDIAYNETDSYLLDGYFKEWLQLLARLEDTVADDAVLYVGHGTPAGKAVLGWQASYVRAFVDVVSDNLACDEQERHDAVVRAMSGLANDDRLAFLMELSIEPAAISLRTDRFDPKGKS